MTRVRSFLSFAFSAAALATLAACAAPGPFDTASSAPGTFTGTKLRWVCGGGRLLHVGYTGGLAEVTVDGATWLIPRAPAASGARYADSSRELWQYQGRLTYRTIGLDDLTCFR